MSKNQKVFGSASIDIGSLYHLYRAHDAFKVYMLPDAEVISVVVISNKLVIGFLFKQVYPKFWPEQYTPEMDEVQYNVRRFVILRDGDTLDKNLKYLFTFGLDGKPAYLCELISSPKKLVQVTSSLPVHQGLIVPRWPEFTNPPHKSD